MRPEPRMGCSINYYWLTSLFLGVLYHFTRTSILNRGSKQGVSDKRHHVSCKYGSPGACSWNVHKLISAIFFYKNRYHTELCKLFKQHEFLLSEALTQDLTWSSVKNSSATWTKPILQHARTMTHNAVHIQGWEAWPHAHLNGKVKIHQYLLNQSRLNFKICLLH